jgi:DNA-binding NarL/FixJ family response regulator
MRVVVLGDDAVLRAGIRAVLAASSHLAILAEGATGSAVLSLAEKFAPDVPILDASLPGIGELEVTRLRHGWQCPAPIPVLTVYNDAQNHASLIYGRLGVATGAAVPVLPRQTRHPAPMSGGLASAVVEEAASLR